MKLVMFAGAGSVGKTTMLDNLVKAALNIDITTAFHKSSTRKTYKQAGLTEEKQALNNEAFNKEFQVKVLNDNFVDLMKEIKKAKAINCELFITDRSLYDYLGYYFCVFQSSLTVDTIKTKRIQVEELMSIIKAEVEEIMIVEFPYPAIWSVDNESSDGWRADKTGKNFVWASIVSSEIKRHYNPLVVNTTDNVVISDRILEELFN